MKKLVTVLLLSFLLGNLVANVSYEPDFCPIKDKKLPGEYLSKTIKNDVEFKLNASYEVFSNYSSNHLLFDLKDNFAYRSLDKNGVHKVYSYSQNSTSRYTKEKLHLLNCCIRQCRHDSNTFSTYIKSTPLYLLNCTIKQC